MENKALVRREGWGTSQGGCRPQHPLFLLANQICRGLTKAKGSPRGIDHVWFSQTLSAELWL